MKKSTMIAGNIPAGDYAGVCMFSIYVIQEKLKEKYGKNKNILQLLGTSVKKKLLTDGEAIFVHEYGMRIVENDPTIKSNSKKDAIKLAKISGKVLGLKQKGRTI